MATIKIKVGRIEVNGREILPAPQMVITRLQELKADLAERGVSVHYDIAGMPAEKKRPSQGSMKIKRNKRCSVCTNLLKERRFHKFLIKKRSRRWYRCICNTCWSFGYRFKEDGEPERVSQWD